MEFYYKNDTYFKKMLQKYKTSIQRITFEDTKKG